MKQVFILIGYKEENFVKDVWIENGGIRTEAGSAFVGYFICELSSLSDIQTATEEAAKKYDYVKLETVWTTK